MTLQTYSYELCGDTQRHPLVVFTTTQLWDGDLTIWKLPDYCYGVVCRPFAERCEGLQERRPHLNPCTGKTICISQICFRLLGSWTIWLETQKWWELDKRSVVVPSRCMLLSTLLWEHTQTRTHTHTHTHTNTHTQTLSHTHHAVLFTLCVSEDLFRL